MNPARILSLLTLVVAGCADSPPRDPVSRPPWHASPSAAEEPSIEEIADLTLADALRLAAGTLPELAEARALAEAAEGRAEQAGLLPNPEVSLRMEAAPLGRGTTTDADYLLGLSQGIPLGGRLGDARRAHHHEAIRLAAEAHVRERVASRRIRSAFAEALFFEQLALLRERVSELSGGAFKTALARQAAGEATAEEIARARFEAARSSATARASRSRRDASRVALAVSIGRPRLIIRSLSGELEAALEIPAVEDLVRRLQSHPSIAAASADIAAREAFREMALAERIPDLNLDLGYRYIGSGDTHAFDVGISFALPVFGRNQGRLREADADIAAARARARHAGASLEGELRQSLSRLTSAIDALRVARESLAPAIEEVVRVAEVRFAAGDASASELALARRELAAAQVEILEALRDATEAWGEVRELVE